MKRVQQGFTLIELMIVVAIVGILAAIALPAYQDYVIRSKLTEGAARLAEAKTSVAEFVSSKEKYPTTASAGFNSAGAGLVKSVSCVQNSCDLIEVAMSTGANSGLAKLGADNKFVLSAQSSVNGLVVWKCKAAATNGVQSRYLPSSCR